MTYTDMCVLLLDMSSIKLGIWNSYLQQLAIPTKLIYLLYNIWFTYLCASTPILSRSKDPKNVEVKIANASTIVRRRNLQLNISHPLDTTFPRDDVSMAISYYYCFFLLLKITRSNFEFGFWGKGRFLWVWSL